MTSAVREFTDGERARARRLWTFRSHAERHAAARFEQMARDLARFGATTTVVNLAHQAAADEHRHAHLCRTLVESLGGPPLATPPTETFHLPELGLDGAATVLVQTVGMCCLNETISAAVLTDMLKNVRGGPAHATVRAILKDEVTHARLGWAHLAAMAPIIDVRIVGAWIPRLLEEAVRDELFDHGGSDHETAPTGLGGLERATRLALFREAVDGLVFAGLERFGIDTAAGRRWLHTRTGDGEPSRR